VSTIRDTGRWGGVRETNRTTRRVASKRARPFTAEVVGKYLAWSNGKGAFEPHFPFWTKICQLVLGRGANDFDRDGFWNGVAFYNFVQVPAGSAARQRPGPPRIRTLEAGIRERTRDTSTEGGLGAREVPLESLARR